MRSTEGCSVRECNQHLFWVMHLQVSWKLLNLLRMSHVNSKNLRVHEFTVLNNYCMRQLRYVETCNQVFYKSLISKIISGARIWY